MPITYQFIPGTIIIPIGEGRIVTVTPNPEWRNDITESAQIYHANLEELETAKQRLTNPNHETGNTAHIREEIRQALIGLANVTREALEEIAEDEDN